MLHNFFYWGSEFHKIFTKLIGFLIRSDPETFMMKCVIPFKNVEIQIKDSREEIQTIYTKWLNSYKFYQIKIVPKWNWYTIKGNKIFPFLLNGDYSESSLL